MVVQADCMSRHGTTISAAAHSPDHRPRSCVRALGRHACIQRKLKKRKARQSNPPKVRSAIHLVM